MPTTPLGASAKMFRQCQQCHKVEGADVRLLTCAGCSRYHYCSKACQVLHWPEHKLQCKINQNARGKMKADAKETPSGVLSAKEVESRLKKWIQIYRPILQVTLIHALTLQKTPDKCTSDYLMISLAPNFSATSPNSKDVGRSFRVRNVGVMSIAETLEVVSERKDETELLFRDHVQKSKAVQASGDLGIGLICITVREAGLMHWIPFGMEKFSEKDLPMNDDWERDFRHMVENGVSMK